MSDTNPLTTYLATHNAPCPGCGYNLSGLTSGVCPECGRAVLTMDLRGEKSGRGTAFLDTIWIAALLAITIVACFSLLQLFMLSRPHYFTTILLNALMGVGGGVVPLFLRKHGRAWAEPPGREGLIRNYKLMLLTGLAVVLRFLLIVLLGV